MGKLLNKDNSVYVVAPASHTPKKRLTNALEIACQYDLEATHHEDIISPDTFFAASKDPAWSDLKNALNGNDKIIWALRGGWGCMRFLPDLKKLKKPTNPKLLIGYSDITSLHVFLNQEWNWVTLHANNFSNISKALIDIIRGKKTEFNYKIKPFNALAKKSKVTGKLVGGNLKLLQSMIGTAGQINTNGKILFIEDVGERGYSVDRMFEQLIQTKVISNKTKAIVLGQFTEADEPNGKSLVNVAFENLSKRLNVPIYWKLNSGHGNTNHPLFLNYKTTVGGTTLTQNLKDLI